MTVGDLARLHPIAAPATASRFLAVIYGVGGMIALVAAASVSTTVGSGGRLAIFAVGCVATAVGVLLAVMARRARRGAVDACMFLGCGLIAVLSVASDPIGAPFVFYFVWGPLLSAMFSTPLRCLALVVAAAGSPYVLLGGDHWLTWTAAAATELAIAVLVWWMRLRIVRSTAQLREQARTDGLTGLLNRTAFREALDIELERGRRTGRATGLVLCDVDHFKQLNDRHGHAVGDDTLQRIATVLRSGTRAVDAVGRVGGEEFAVMLVDLDDPREATMLAQRLLDAIRELEVAGRSITASAGVAVAPLHASTASALVRTADRALYGAKSAGRDRVHEPDGSAETHVLPPAGASGAYLGTLLALAESFDLRFSGHARHSETVGRYAADVATALGWPPARVHRLRQAAVLHDVGKVCIRREILEKPAALDDAEWEEMRRHPELGAQMLDEPALDDIRAWVLGHHERPDGHGYPFGKRLDAIPQGARILAVADAYEAMVSDRPYRRAMGEDDAIDELRRCAGTQFDAEVVDVFVGLLRPEGMLV